MSGALVPFYFDLISPYSYLAISLIDRRSDLPTSMFELRPVALGSVFSALEVMGPGDVPYRRRYGLADVLLLAQHYGLPLEGPPRHPFNSLYGLRAVSAVEAPEQRFDLALRLFQAAWGEGLDLEKADVLSRCFEEVGLDFDPEEVASRRETRQAIKSHTQSLLAAGGFGVPTFDVAGQLLFGHDRFELLLALVSGAVRPEPEKLERLLARPRPGAS
jgi:2-hydroxychromene-2-carboxylate isomerase